MTSLLQRIGRWLGRRPRRAWLGDSVVLLVGRGRAPRGAEELGSATVAGKRVRLYRAAAPPGYGGTEQLEELLRNEFPDLEDEGGHLMDLILDATKVELERPDTMDLRRALEIVRDAVRPSVPTLMNHADTSLAAAVDSIEAIDERSFVALGWLHDPGGVVESIEAISPEGQRVELLQGAYRRRRPDVEAVHQTVAGEEQGFTRYFELAVPSRLGAEWIVELRDRAGRTFELNRPVAIHDLRQTKGYLLNHFRVSRLLRDDATFANTHPPLARIQTIMRDQVRVTNVVQYGEPPPDPKISIIVPLYQRIDLVEHQLAHFGHDPEIAQADLIYVLDSPGAADELGRVAPALQELHAVPFRVATLNRNGGFAIANNLGAQLARGDVLLLLNSDVMPDEPGWLGTMAAFHAATPDVGAVGAKLLFEDDSIQHAGMYFQRSGETALWTNQHYFKGFSRSLDAANVTRPVPAVTAACMMIERTLYEQVGGLWHGYVDGGSEDSDLCIRLLDAGRRNWYLADVELYHLEAQSYRTPDRTAHSYNSWLQTHLVGERIEEIMRAQAEGPDAHVLSPDLV